MPFQSHIKKKKKKRNTFDRYIYQLTLLRFWKGKRKSCTSRRQADSNRNLGGLGWKLLMHAMSTHPFLFVYMHELSLFFFYLLGHLAIIIYTITHLPSTHVSSCYMFTYCIHLLFEYKEPKGISFKPSCTTSCLQKCT